MLNALIIVLRETLEASHLVSFLFIFSNYFNLNKRWVLHSLMSGIILAFIVAFNLSNISELFDGIGQEMLFIFVLIVLSLCILFVNKDVIFLSATDRPNALIKSSLLRLKFLFSMIILLAVSLEGAEIIVFFESRLIGHENIYPNLLGGVLGLGIGVSMAAVSYYILTQLKDKGLLFSIILLSMIAGGMATQAISYLMQADLIDNAYPIWNTNSWIKERSITGQLLYALIGYEATPTLLQVITYIAYLLIPMSFIVFFKKTLHI